jgi:hypothetical protein
MILRTKRMLAPPGGAVHITGSAASAAGIATQNSPSS